MGRLIRETGFRGDISDLIANRNAARDALYALGQGELVQAMDDLRMWRGRTDYVGTKEYGIRFKRVERLVAE
jgi:hypothetical protein